MDKSDGEQEASDVEQNNPAPPTGTVMRAQRSIVWLYFKCVDPESKYSRCLICKKILSHSTTLTNLKKHLARKHPDVKIPEREDGRKRILLSSGGELYEVETNSKLDDDEILAHDDDTQHDQTVEMDTVYLEDFDALDTTPLKKKQRQAKAEKTKIPEFESSSEDEITFSNKFTKKKCDSLDHFGKYLVSLLRNLPRETSNTLQADFVKQIMSVQTSDAPITATDTYSTVTDIFDQKGDKIN
ncbi:uncharacterized protein LOC113227306 [Hyposmocoma kahamanoa]|uniref:uncharacterized protein LOC113227306 n=1 Tax=Hyposmocoma kahamanoa TaxID=1477025 RepID=UPI000E6DA21F|nr:uncharacterized protein LOC113227306 [Hyposmocoma kahamanoa]